MPADRSTLLALAERAEAGGDDRLSDDVWRALGYEKLTGGLWFAVDTLGPVRLGDLRTSLDAQEAMPGRIVDVSTREIDKRVVVTAVAEHEGGWGRADAGTEKAARLSAKLRAMAAATPEERG